MIARTATTLLLPCVVALMGLVLASCEGTGEQDDLAQAQACLDAVPSSAPAGAQACLRFLSGYTSAQSNMLRCSIYLTSAGLTEDKLVQAYTSLRNSTGTNKEALFMAALSLDVPDVNTAYATAVTGNQYCQISGSGGMAFVGSAVVAGTNLNQVIASLTGSGVDPNDSAGMSSKVATLLTDCTSASPPAACTANLPALGSTILTLSNAYCGNASANADVCATVNSAVGAAGAVPAKVGRAFYCYLDQKTYDSSLDQCM